MQGDGSNGSTSTSQVTIDRVNSEDITYSDFCEKYLEGNRPCIFASALINGWDALDAWTGCGAESDKAGSRAAGQATIFDRLGACYCDHIAPVVVGDEEDRREMSIAEAIKLIKDGEQFIYIKDWHLIRQEKLHGKQDSFKAPYEVPDYFADDWMNNRQSDDEDDFRFCYAGTAGTRTNIHRDVYTSYSWSTNVVGKKLWRLFPPSAKQHLRRYPLVSTSEIASSVDRMRIWAAEGKLGHVKDGKMGWPEWDLAMKECIEVVQEERETIFVPSDWHHEVVNLTDCISINHNWCNSTNINSMYWSMCQEVGHVEEALSDVKAMMKQQGQDGWQTEWTATVQQILASNAGWAWQGFWEMVEHNLRFPPCRSSLRPSLAYIAAELLPCLADFLLRQDYVFLTEATRVAAVNCETLLKRISSDE